MADNRNLMILTCGECGQKMKIPANAMGKTYKCVKCGGHVKVQGDSVAPLGVEDGGVVRSAPGHPPAEPVGQLLLGAGLITQEQLQECLEEQQRSGAKLFEIMISRNCLTKAQLHEFLSKQPGVAAIELSRFSIDRELTSLIPREMALDNLALPIDRLGKLLTVAMACPLDMVTIASIEQHTGLRVKAMLCKYDDIDAAVKKFYAQPGGEMFVFQLPETLREEARLDVGDRAAAWSQIPVDKELAKKLKALAEQPDATPQTLLKALIQDPGLSVAVLKMANTTVYGMAGEVDTLPLALLAIGAPGVAAVAGQYLSAPPMLPSEQTWRRLAVQAGQTAQALAKSSGRVDRSLAQAAALVHNIGRSALHAVSTEKYSRVDPSLTGPGLVAAELKYFQQDHQQVGGNLAVRWRLPNPLFQGIRFYAHPEQAEAERDLVAMVALAAWLNSGNRAGSAPDETAQGWARTVGLKWSAVESAAAEAQAALASGA